MGPPFLNGGNRCRVCGEPWDMDPSMGPPFLNGGNLLGRREPAPGWVPFNGAAVSQRRKPRHPALRFPFRRLLQWGRRFSTAETRAPLFSDVVRQHLQWGRRFSTAETRALGGKWYAGDTFNGAAVSQRRKL